MNDELSRQRILQDLDTNFLVEAAAGTGKTTSIVGRMVNLIATGKCDIERLAAMTFTRKAAAELRERFQLELRRQAASIDRSDQQRMRLQVALRHVEQAFIGTIHSFCTLLLRERPIEMNVGPNFRELEQAENDQLIDWAWAAFLDQLHESNDPLLLGFQEFGVHAADLKACFCRYVSNPDIDRWPHTARSLSEFDLDGLKGALRNYIDRIATLKDDFPTARGTDELMDRLERIERKSQHIHWDRLGDVFDLTELFDWTSKCTQKCWHDKTIAKQEHDHFVSFRKETIQPAMHWWYGYRYEFAIRVLHSAGKVFDRMRGESNGLNFEDLLQKSAIALKLQPSLRAYFQRRFHCLLIDEFQDTDPIQAQVIAFLTAAELTQQVWHLCRPRPGSLFLVGDPKQSIYRFRRADIVTYAKMKQMFQDGAGEVLSLSRNFRSTLELREWNNEVYEGLFPAIATLYAPAANSMTQGRQDVVEGQLRGLRCLTLPDDLSHEETIAIESQRIANSIRGAIAGQ
jgi:ATP-dependent helicase/nuclease subunit A